MKSCFIKCLTFYLRHGRGCFFRWDDKRAKEIRNVWFIESKDPGEIFWIDCDHLWSLKPQQPKVFAVKFSLREIGRTMSVKNMNFLSFEKMPKSLNFKFSEGWYFLNCDNTELKRSSTIFFSVSDRHRWAVVGKTLYNVSMITISGILEKVIHNYEAYEQNLTFFANPVGNGTYRQIAFFSVHACGRKRAQKRKNIKSR